MNTMTTGVAVLGFLCVMGTWGVYLAKIPKKGVPLWPMGSVVAQCIGVGLALVALVLNFQGNLTSSKTATVLAVISLMFGSFFLWLLTQRKTPVGDIKVKVGDKLLPFDLVASDGETFHTDQMAGKRLLLKFYRGGW